MSAIRRHIDYMQTQSMQDKCENIVKINDMIYNLHLRNPLIILISSENL